MSGLGTLSFVKAEPEDISLPRESSREDVPERTHKRRRLIMVVEVPTLEEVNQRRRALAAKLACKEEPDVKPWISQVKNKAKKGPKALPEFKLDTINERLDILGPAGQHNFDVPIEDIVKCTAVPRRFFSSTWGGNPQETFPSISDKFLKKHGLNDFMYPNLLWNPHGPQVAGCAGLFFEPNGLDTPNDDSTDIHRVIVRLPEGPIWLYVGQYQLIASPSLTKEEWLLQAQKVRNTWAREILKKGWGSHVRTRVGLRKRLGREPSKREFEAALAAESIPVTQDDIRNAYDKGEERLGVYVLKCVAYDEAFQRKVFEDIQTWVPPPPKEKGSRGAKGSKTHKRKQVEEVSSDSDPTSDDVFEDDEEEAAEEYRYIPRGTKSRPRSNL
ncbi:hypothetical protein PILCRDRAFT_822359 [Piloderma croceum F 1598]|uniref:DUF6697 domain-containing protein n=1 Tax=Piloderma croceum (strain F 1598) TaxID=765440 RepID=A0A0C3FLQ5_PILCF|nr:hypothetical protein PILCRDRAFT_822359 [Piloderma croceum F 1598]